MLRAGPDALGLREAAKAFVVAGTAVYMYDAEAQQLTKAPFKLDKLSASVSFLPRAGQAGRRVPHRQGNPDRPSPGARRWSWCPSRPTRFDRIFFVVDPKTSAVTQSLVVDPDGSENHMAFTAVKTVGLGAEAFHFEPRRGRRSKRHDPEPGHLARALSPDLAPCRSTGPV